MICYIAQDIRNAYWRAVTSELLMGQVDQLIDVGYKAYHQTRQLEKEKIQPLVITLNYQKMILDAISKLFKQRRELALAKAELGSLMNLEPGTPFQVVATHKKQLVVPDIQLNVDMLENIALLHRPELWEEDYNERISKDEIYKTYMSIFPGINLEARRNYDSNSFLYNQSWTDYSAKIGLQLFRLMSVPSRLKAARTKKNIVKERRLALSMAILTQVHLSLERYAVAKKEYDFTKKIDRVSHKIALISKSKEQARLEDNLKVIEDQAAGLIAHIRRYAAYTEVQGAYGRLLNSIGVDPFPFTEGSMDLDMLTQKIQENIGASDQKLDNSTIKVYTENK